MELKYTETYKRVSSTDSLGIYDCNSKSVQVERRKMDPEVVEPCVYST